MDIYPAIDILDGRCVRLAQGDYQQETIYNPSPLAQAVVFEELGADCLHIVDLDAAKTGQPKNLAVIEAICAQTKLHIQVGGGVRSKQAAQRLTDVGVDRVVVGTAAIENPDLVVELATGMSVALGLDVRSGKVSTHGWQQTTAVGFIQLLRDFEEVPLDAVIITDIAQDGMLSGPNLQLYRTALETTGLPVIASGGVGTLAHLHQLADLKLDSTTTDTVSLSGVIVGKALYEGKVELQQALKLSK